MSNSRKFRTETQRVTIVVEREDAELWKEAAHLRKVTLSEWARRVLNATARSTKEKAS